MRKKIFLKTMGCQMNVHDSEQMAALMEHEGYALTEDSAGADLIIVNTCSVRAKPAGKVFSELGRYRVLKKDNPELIIVVAGCVAQENGQAMLEKVPYVDIVIGTHNIHRLPLLVEETRRRKAKSCSIDFHEQVKSLGIEVRPSNGKASAFVTIMQGCDNFCSYCIVPYVRGREHSRPLAEIIHEIKTLAEYGVKEVTLLGQNVNSYGADGGDDFARLLQEVNAIDGIERIRFTTSHPRDLSKKMMCCFADLKKLCEHIHLPFQSGSNRILDLMGRGYTREDYLQRVTGLRALCPDIAISADVIVGFPSESETDFQDTLDLMREVRFDNLFSFKYSSRPGTRAQKMSDDVSLDQKAWRLSTLQKMQAQQTLKNNKLREGLIEEVLVEGWAKKGGGSTGRTRGNRVVNFAGDESNIGKLVDVFIKTGFQNSLKGELRGQVERKRE